MPRSLVAALVLAFSFAVSAQTSVTPQQVQLLAPQLIAFAGSSGNFAALVNGLALGIPVTLLTPGADGQLQVATFTPPVTASAADIALALETARTSLIARGIAAPTAQQLAVALMGGGLPTPAGSVQVAGVLTGTISATAVQVRSEFAGLGAGAGATSAGLSTAPTLTRQGGALTLSSSAALGAGQLGAGQQLTFATPGAPLSDVEASQALFVASQLLAQLGIFNPTLEQLRAALVGGTIALGNGVSLPLLGILQGRLRNTSDSPVIGVSNSPLGNVSNSALPGTVSKAPVTASDLLPTPSGVLPIPSPDTGIPRGNTAEGANRAATGRRGG